MFALGAFRLGNRRAQSDGKIICKMVSADGDCGCVPHHAAGKDNQLRGASADVKQAATELALILRQTRFGRSQRLEHCVADNHAGFIHGVDHILRRRRRSGDDVHVGFQAPRHHSDGVANVILRINEKFLRQHMQDFAILRQTHVLRRFDGAAHIVAMNFARALAQRDSAAAVHAAHVPAGDSHQRRFHRDAHNVLRFLDRAPDGTHRELEIHDLALAPTLRFRRTQRREFHGAAISLNFADERAGFCAADVESHNVAILFPQTAAP